MIKEIKNNNELYGFSMFENIENLRIKAKKCLHELGQGTFRPKSCLYELRKTQIRPKSCLHELRKMQIRPKSCLHELRKAQIRPKSCLHELRKTQIRPKSCLHELIRKFFNVCKRKTAGKHSIPANETVSKTFSFSLLVFSLLFAFPALSQNLQGTVYSIEKDKKIPLAGASVYLSTSKTGTLTRADGTFKISKTNQQTEYLVVSFIGFNPDSMQISQNDISEPLTFVLTAGVQQLDETLILGNRQGTQLSAITALKTETITSTGLMKMACCNLSESFENSATVTVGFTDAISGAKQVQLLGLSGIYSQMLAENIPTMRGLAATYGWSYTPGVWLESIQISKGASSVVNGYESVTGQMNLEFKKPNRSEPLFINFYTDDARRYEGNLTSAVQVAKNLWTSLLLHGSSEQDVHDKNNDTFLDMPKTKLVNAYNRWFYLDAERGIQSRTGIKFLYENRIGGQDSACHEGNEPLFETQILNQNFTVYNKTGIAVGDSQKQSLGIINSLTFHRQTSDFGKKSFGGTQISYFANLMFSSFIGSETHRYTAGGGFSYDKYDTHFEDSLEFNLTPRTQIGRTEAVPGIYAEYTYSPHENLAVMLGLRGDYNSRFGFLVTPRGNIRYNAGKHLVFRASAGRGFRSPNVLSDNIGLMASSRKFDISEINSLGMEKAWNFGGNISVYIPVWNGRRATFSVDYFHTEFQNQAVVDIERDRYSVFFYNLSGRSYADAVQGDFSATLFSGFELFAAFRYNSARVTYSHEGRQYERSKPLLSSYRGLLNLSYATRFRRWVFDATVQFNGPSRLPGMNGYTSQDIQSKAFTVWFAQISKNFKRLDFYLGVENILNYTQKDPILGWNMPFHREFDSSLIWGPLMGRKIYGGLRCRIGKLF